MIASLLRLTPALALFALASASAASLAQTQPALPMSAQRAIEAAARRDLQAFGNGQPIPGVFIAIDMPGYAPYVKSVGFANLQARTPFRLADKFRIGSNTKTFVVTVLLQLADEHRLSLDDPISKFNLGVNVPNAGKITVRNLCEMRSGLFEAYNTQQFDKLDVTPQTHLTARQLVGWAAMHKPLFAPGAKYNYSNTNYLILGLIIEKLTHDTVGNQIRKRLLAPMGLNGTSFPQTAAMPTPFSHGYQPQGKDGWSDVTVDIPPSITWAAGAMVSTVPAEAVGQVVRARHHEQQSNAARAFAVFADRCGEKSRLRVGHRLRQRLVRLHGRTTRLSHRGLLFPGKGHYGNRFRQRAARAAVPRRGKCDSPGHHADHHAG